MKDYILLSEKRDSSLKAKQMRKSGIVPAVVYGHHLDPISIQIKREDAVKFLHNNSIGSKVLLKINGEEHLAIFKDCQRDSLNYKINHIDFQALTSGEKVKVTIPIHYLNKDSVEKGTVLQEQMSEIEISALPKFLIDHVDIDVSQYSLGDSVLVSDLDVSKDKNIEVLSSQESQVCVITHVAKFVEEAPQDEAESEEAAAPAEAAEE